MNQIGETSQNIDKLMQMGIQIDHLLVRQQTYLDIFADDNSYKQSDENMTADMLAESTTNIKRLEIAKNLLWMMDKYKQNVLQPLLDNQEKMYALILRFDALYKGTDFNTANYDEGITKIETRYKRWLLLTEELHQEILNAITAVQSLLNLNACIPNHIIKNNGNSKVNISSEEFVQKGAAVELYKQARTREKDISKKRPLLLIELIGESGSNAEKKRQEITSKQSTKATAQTKAVKSRLLLQLEALISCETGITLEFIKPLLESSSESLLPTEVGELVKLASKQVSIWKAEWKFSPFHSPNTTAKKWSEAWDSLRKKWLIALEEVAPGVKEIVEKAHNLEMLAPIASKLDIYYSSMNPLKRFAATSLEKLAHGLYKFGLNSIASRIMLMVMYPKGTVGRVSG